MATAGSFKPGQSGNVKGRPKGVPNKMSKAAKENVEWVFEKMGSRRSMLRWAKEHPNEYYKYYIAKMVPNRQEVTGKDGENLFSNLPDDELSGRIKERLATLSNLKELLPDGM